MKFIISAFLVCQISDSNDLLLEYGQHKDQNKYDILAVKFILTEGLVYEGGPST